MIKKAKQFIEDVQIEMKKVNWPERTTLINTTVVVVVVSAIFTVFIFLADSVSGKKMVYLTRLLRPGNQSKGTFGKRNQF
jgi:preprotein translocase subunit SecE